MGISLDTKTTSLVVKHTLSVLLAEYLQPEINGEGLTRATVLEELEGLDPHLRSRALMFYYHVMVSNKAHM